ncbi:MAG TPA: CHRD domain-containing protein [Nitrososphaeraceae archaeon]
MIKDKSVPTKGIFLTSFVAALLIVNTLVWSGNVSILVLAQKQQQVTYTATLTGKNENPPVNAQATGMAKFTPNSNDTLSYEVNTNNIDGVIGAHIIESNGSLLAQVFDPYAIHNGKSGIPTGKVNGVLSTGTITSDDLDGPLAGKKITDLVSLMKQGKAFVEIRTLDHEKGEIKGQVKSPTK